MGEVAAAPLIFDDEGRVLLVRERDVWQFPGGRLEPGETAEEALAREAREEMGVELTIERKLAVYEWEDGFSCHVFVCAIARGTPSPVGVLELGWFDPVRPPEPLGRVARRALSRP